MSKIHMSELYERSINKTLAKNEIFLNEELLHGLVSQEGEVDKRFILKKVKNILENAFRAWNDVPYPQGGRGPMVRVKSIEFLDPRQQADVYAKATGYDLMDSTLVLTKIVLVLFGRDELVKLTYIPVLTSGGGNEITGLSKRYFISVFTDTDIAPIPTVTEDPKTKLPLMGSKLFVRFTKDKLTISRVPVRATITKSDKGLTLRTAVNVYMLTLYIQRKATQHTLKASLTEFTDKAQLPLLAIMMYHKGIRETLDLLLGNDYIVKPEDEIKDKDLKTHIFVGLPEVPTGCKRIDTPFPYHIGVPIDKYNTVMASSIVSVLYFLAHDGANRMDLDVEEVRVLFARVFRSKKVRMLAISETITKLKSYDSYLSHGWLSSICKQIPNTFDRLVPEEPGGFGDFVHILHENPEWLISAGAIVEYEGCKRLEPIDNYLNSVIGKPVNKNIISLLSVTGDVPTPPAVRERCIRMFGRRTFFKNRPTLIVKNTGSSMRASKGCLDVGIQNHEGGARSTAKGTGVKVPAVSIINPTTCLVRTLAASVKSGSDGMTMPLLSPFIKLDKDGLVVTTAADLKRVKRINEILGHRMEKVPENFRRADFSVLDS